MCFFFNNFFFFRFFVFFLQISSFTHISTMCFHHVCLLACGGVGNSSFLISRFHLQFFFRSKFHFFQVKKKMKSELLYIREIEICCVYFYHFYQLKLIHFYFHFRFIISHCDFFLIREVYS